MSDVTDIARAARLALSGARLLAELQKASFGPASRWPAGAPGSKGGQFAPKQTGGSQHITAPQYGIGALKPQAQATTWKETGWAGSGQWSKPSSPPPGAKPHPKTDDKGNSVTINYPTMASPAATWSNPSAVATFVPGGKAPEALNGVQFKSWKPPSAGWGAVAGTKPSLDEDFPFEPHPTKHTAAGVVIIEPDGRVWLTKPTNEFGGYQHTYPKGTCESGLTMQQNAIKEAWEETGLKVRIVGVLGDLERDTSKARFYVARRVGGTPSDMGWESQALRLAPRAQAEKLLNKPHDRQLLTDFFDEMDPVKKKAEPKQESGKAGHWMYQKRWPRGTPLGGQWQAMGADGITAPPKIAGGLTGSNSIYQKAANLAHDLAQKGSAQDIVKIATKYTDHAKAFAAGQKQSSHGKWGAQVFQYVTQVIADVAMKDKASVSADAISGPQKLSGMTKVGDKPGGSNPGGMYTDADGKWLVKGSNSAHLAGGGTARAQNEVLASKLMHAVGAGAPEMKLVELGDKYGGGIGVASKWIDGGNSLDKSNAAHIAAARADFAVHAWLGNYDAIGMGADNTRIYDGKAVNIDPGGALLYRAQGAPKGDTFTSTAVEFDSLRHSVPGVPSNPEAWSVYGGMTKSELVASAEKLKAIDDATITKLVSTYGPGTSAEKAALAEKLIARRNDILARVAALQPAPAAAPAAPVAAPTKAPAATKMPAMPAFVGETAWQYGVHAKAARKLALAGNLRALVAYGIGFNGNPKWGGSGPNAQAMVAYHKELVSYVEGKQAKAAAKAAKAAAASAPAKPDLAAFTAPAVKKAVKTMTAAIEKATAAELEAQLTPVNGKLIFKTPTGGTYTINEVPTTVHGAAIANYAKAMLAHKKGLQGDTPAAAAPAAAPVKTQPLPDPLQWVDLSPPASWPNPESANYYNSEVAKVQKLFDAGDLEGLKNAVYKPKKPGMMAWPLGSANGKMMHEWHQKMVTATELKKTYADLKAAKEAKAALDAQAAAAQPVPAPGTAKGPLPAMPDFNKYMLPSSNSNATSNNAKVAAIHAMAIAGNVHGLLATAYGSNTYGKKQAQLASDALAALGSPHKVSAGQKANSHAALTGGVPPAAVAAAAATAGVSPPAPPPMPKPKIDTAKLDVSKADWPPPPAPFKASSKAWVNDQNNELAAKVKAVALSGNLDALKAMTYQEISKETGQPTGLFKPMSEHPAKGLSSYHEVMVATLNDIANPPKPIKHFDVKRAASIEALIQKLPGHKLGVTVNKVPKNERVGFFMALGQLDDISHIAPKPEEIKPVSNADIQDAFKKFPTMSSGAQSFIHGVQGGGLNSQYRHGIDKHDKSAAEHLRNMAKEALKYSTKKPPGTVIYKNIDMTTDMVDKLLAAKPGLVLQSDSPMCASYLKDNSSTRGFGHHKIEFVYAPGARAIDSHGSGGYSSEKEITLLPMARFVLMKPAKKIGSVLHATFLLLPPEPPGYDGI